MNCSYYVKENGQGPEDAYVFLNSAREWSEEDLEYLAEQAANWAWDHADGWEWVDGSFFTILLDGKEIGTCEIEVTAEPVFSVVRK